MCRTRKLTEGYRSDREGANAKERDPDVDKTRDRLDRDRPADGFVRSNKRIIQTADELIARGDLILQGVDPDTMKPFEESFYDVNELRPDFDEKSPLLEQGEADVQAVLDNTKKADQAAKTSSKRRYLNLAVGIAVTSALAYGMYELIRRMARGEGTADIPVPPDVREQLKLLVDKWRDAPDSAFWNDFANAIDSGLVLDSKATPFTIADQIVFLNFTVDLCPLKQPWSWDTAKAIEDNALGIKAFYDKSEKISDIYRHVLEVKGNNQGTLEVMPRAVAAGQLKLVLGWLSAAAAD